MSLWAYQESNLTLNLTVAPHYYIDLERCNSSAQILDWIIQVSKKPWATDEILSALVRALDGYLDIQGNISSMGVDHKFNARKWTMGNRKPGQAG